MHLGRRLEECWFPLLHEQSALGRGHILQRSCLVSLCHYSHLKVTEQCQEAYHKANRMLGVGLVKRTIVHRDPAIMVRLYKSLVRP